MDKVLLVAALIGSISGVLWFTNAYRSVVEYSQFGFLETNILRWIYGSWAIVAGAVGIVGIPISLWQCRIRGIVLRLTSLLAVGGLLLTYVEVAMPLTGTASILLLVAAGMLYGIQEYGDHRHEGTQLEILTQTVAGISWAAQLYVAVAFLTVGLFIPLWWMAIMYGVWWLMFLLLRWLQKRKAWVTPAVPLGTYILLTTISQVGQSIFGWVP